MTSHHLPRRHFIRQVLLAGGALVLGIELSACDKSGQGKSDDAQDFASNLWLTLFSDGRVDITLSKSEMGQGVYTALAMLVAEELDANWQQVSVKQADTSSQYGSMATAGSTSIRDMWQPLRQAGATARAMLLQAAARTWGVAESECQAHSGKVKHAASGRELGYGELVAVARTLTTPSQVSLKKPSEYLLIGQPLLRLDNPDKVTGKARYGLDTSLPGLKYAAIRQAPVFGAELAGFDEQQALARPGVRAVVKMAAAVAVVADSWWLADKTLNDIPPAWQGGNASLSDEVIRQDYQKLLQQPGELERETGTLSDQQATSKISADYRASFQAHATMEPMNCTVWIHDGLCEIWAPTQHPQYAEELVREKLQSGVGKMLGKVKDKLGMADQSVRVHTTLLGGGFGRRLEQDYVLQAVEIAQACGCPVKLIWNRVEDIQHDFYRPYTAHVLQADLAADGRVLSWRHRIAGPSHGRSVGGASHLPYRFDHFKLDYHVKKHSVPIGSWRSVGSSHNTFVTECFLDELAHAARRDSYQFRRGLLEHNPRARAVLDKAAEMSGWGRKLPPGKGLGLALLDDFGSVVCQVAEVEVNPATQSIRVVHVFCVVDCGMVINPAIVTAQIEGGIAFALTATLKSQINIEQGQVRQSNLHDFGLLAFHEMPPVTTYIMPSVEPPGGIGEVGVPPLAPAVANAVFVAGGIRHRQLPLTIS
jgi:isoquinoline 1-oxidoreductase beta subunit